MQELNQEETYEERDVDINNNNVTLSLSTSSSSASSIESNLCPTNQNG